MISIAVARELLYLKYACIGLGIALIVAIAFAVIGLKDLLFRRKLKNAAKKGYVQAIILGSGKAITKKLIKLDKVIKDIGNVAYIFDKTAAFVDPKYNLKTWFFFEGNAYPIGIDEDSKYLDGRYLYYAMQREAAATASPIEKYFKVILIVLFGLVGLILLLAGGAH